MKRQGPAQLGPFDKRSAADAFRTEILSLPTYEIFLYREYL
ncbi:MAG TPA: hypothetical protein VGR81_07185 [Candidatus Acidoferrales bacterium]|nr:hypothetical protein [Candidatus Acidoferrales bacterium]